MKFDIDKFVDRFIRKQLSPFSAADLQKEAGIAITRKAVEAALSCHPYVYNYGKKKYISRPGIFAKKTFTIAPLSSEISTGILIIGHRCLPFTDPELLPGELEFTYQGKSVPKKKAVVKTQEAFEHYALFGEEYAVQFFALDPVNDNLNFAETDYALPSVISITVLDMEALYNSWNFSAGDRLTASVTDWDAGIIEIAPVFSVQKGAVIGGSEDEKRREWFDLFEKALLVSFETAGPCDSIDEQLVYAYLSDGEKLFSTDGASAEEFLRYTRKIGFEEYGVETRLWKLDEEIPVFGFEDDIENLQALDFFLGRMGFPVAETVVDAYLYDSLYKKEDTIKSLANRLVPAESVIDKRQFEDFLLHLDSRRGILKRSYNWFADFQKGQLRQKTLELYSQVLEFVCFLEDASVPTHMLPQQPLIVLMQLHGHMLYILEAVAPDASLNEKDFSSMYFSLEGMFDSLEEIRENLKDALEKNTKSRFSVIKKPDSIKDT